MIKKLISIFAALALPFAFFGCSDYIKAPTKTLSTGKLLSPDEIENIKVPLEEEKVYFVIDENTVYYWTKSGSKFHVFKDCQALSRSEERDISSGNLDDAGNAGKEALCGFCKKRGNLTGEEF